MREIDPIGDGEFVSPPVADGSAREIAETVYRNAGRLVKAGDQKGGSEMGEMMFDVVKLGFDFVAVGLFQPLLHRCRAADVSDLLQHQRRTRPVSENKLQPSAVVSAGLTIDRDVLDVAPSHASFAKAIIDRHGRQTGPMLDPAKTF